MNRCLCNGHGHKYARGRTATRVVDEPILRSNPKLPVSNLRSYYLNLGNKQIYSAKTNVFWEYKQELVNRRKFRIEQEYDILRNNSANVSESADFARHIFVLSMIRTRQVHSSCDTRLQRVQGTYIHCPRIIKRRRALTLAGNRGRKVKWCVDEAGVFLYPQADCEQGQARNTEICNAGTSLLTGELL
ncbi:hypothetical protein BJV82DRAFT_626346 [Fennellomyces sp. T-0311]|nr:hypothetical protein BJV82DRAFT_626346 [Fennellomyces sp. T-0311]